MCAELAQRVGEGYSTYLDASYHIYSKIRTSSFDYLVMCLTSSGIIATSADTDKTAFCVTCIAWQTHRDHVLPRCGVVVTLFVSAQ